MNTLPNDPFHAGEKRVQARAGVREMARRVGATIRDHAPDAARQWLHSVPLGAVGFEGVDGRVWASLCGGSAGWMNAPDATTLEVDLGDLHPRDPLRERVEAGVFESGWCLLDPATRRRMRFNGVARATGSGRLRVEARQVYSNCPKYIGQRVRLAERPLDPIARGVAAAASGQFLSAPQRLALEKCDTLFWATLGPDGADCSHRGGNPGWLRVGAQTLSWDDYSGNAMFNTLGNLEGEPRCGLVTLDWENGIARQLCGHARVIWHGENRVVNFEIERWREEWLPVLGGWELQELSPFNPPIAESAP